MDLATIDLLVFSIYIGFIIFLGLWVSREKKGHIKDSKDYFLASKALPWWAIGTSIIASNISAEQFIGMSGSGYALGLGIATYEWMAAATLIIVAKFFIPVFLKEGVYTMPQFLSIRYDNRVRTGLAFFWLMLYVFVNLTSVLYLGALSLETIMGIDMWYGIAGLALFSVIYSLYGGLKAVAWTDVVQVCFLIGGGLITTYLALDAVSDGNGVLAGFTQLLEDVPEKFDMIFERGATYMSGGEEKSAYDLLPGWHVLIGAMWVINLNYWGCNQYITQRALGAKSLEEAQRGLVFAGYLKLLMPVIVVLPGIAAFVLNPGLTDPDKAYPWLLDTFVPVGFKGAAFAALIAAIVSSLSSMINSTSTIFSMDIYNQFINKNATETQLVKVGRIAAFVALIFACFTAIPLLGQLDQAFQYIQKYTGWVSPGIVAIFVFGLFWRKTTSNAVLWAVILTLPLSGVIEFFLPGTPFIIRMGEVFLLLSAVIIGISLWEGKGKEDPKAFHNDYSLFYTSNTFNILAMGICAILAVLYTVFY